MLRQRGVVSRQRAPAHARRSGLGHGKGIALGAFHTAILFFRHWQQLKPAQCLGSGAGHVPVVLDELEGGEVGLAEVAEAEALEDVGEGGGIAQGLLEAENGEVGGFEAVAFGEVAGESARLQFLTEAVAGSVEAGGVGEGLDEDRGGGGGEASEGHGERSDAVKCGGDGIGEFLGAGEMGRVGLGGGEEGEEGDMEFGGMIAVLIGLKGAEFVERGDDAVSHLDRWAEEEGHAATAIGLIGGEDRIDFNCAGADAREGFGPEIVVTLLEEGIAGRGRVVRHG